MRILDALAPRKRIGRLEREILDELSLGDTTVGFLCSWNSAYIMRKVAYRRAAARLARKRALARLVASGHVNLMHGPDGDVARLTPRGKASIERVVRNMRQQHRKNIWDGVWRLVAFDIPEEHRKHRDALRSVLHRAGCIKIQQSIYVYPHPCAELEELLNTNPLLKRRVIYATATRISNEDTLKRRFKLE